MSEVIKCDDCRRVFADIEEYMNHLIIEHPDTVLNYLNKKWDGVTCCPGGCGTLYKTNDLTPETRCYDIKHKKPYPIGRWAFRLAARFIAASNADKAKKET